jgi:hypothetical protein
MGVHVIAGTSKYSVGEVIFAPVGDVFIVGPAQIREGGRKWGKEFE